MEGRQETCSKVERVRRGAVVKNFCHIAFLDTEETETPAWYLLIILTNFILKK